MKRQCIFQCAVVVLILAFCAFGPTAFAQTPHHYHIRVVPHGPQAESIANANPAPTAGLYGLTAAFTATPFPYGTDSSGNDWWPCPGSATAPGTTGTGDPDCNTILTGAWVLGNPQYVWSFAACDQSTASDTTPCGQTETFYEDDSNDATDDLLYTIEIEQGTSVIADSGTVDFGPNPYGGLTPPGDVIIYGDQGFGTLGATGKNNGNCDADYNYPSPVLPGVFVVAANKTCVDPVPGLATITATTELATPTFTTIKGVTTVRYTKKYSVIQKFKIWLQ